MLPIFEKNVIIIEKNNDVEKKIMENYKYDPEKKKMMFDIKTSYDGDNRQTTGELTDEDIKQIFNKIPQYRGFQLPRRMINESAVIFIKINR